MDKTELTDIFFDLDDTLWDFKRNSALTFEHIFLKNNIDLELNSFLKVFVVMSGKYWTLYRNNQIDREGLRFSRLADSFKELKWNISASDINMLTEDFILHLPDFNHLLPQTVETLQYLYPKYKLHILTNGLDAVQQKKLRNSEIYHYFKTVTSSEENGIKKPHPEIFETALEKAGATKRGSLMIGDNWEADIIGAQAFGLKTIYLSAEEDSDDITIRIKSIAELRSLL